MKKIIIMISVLTMILIMCSCGESEEAKENSTAAASNMTSTLPGVDLKDIDEEKDETFELANTFVEKSVDDLIAAIGEPTSREYTSSCLGDGEDGNLDYGEFWVNTYKENDSEIVKSVNKK